MCRFQVLRGLELFGGTVVAELRNAASVVNTSTYELRKQSCAILEVAQAELRSPGSCASQVSQS